MRRLFFLFLMFSLLSGGPARADLSNQESDSDNRLRLFGAPWNANFFSRAGLETDKVTGEGGRLSTYNYVTFSTRTDGDFRFALRVPFQYNTAGTDRFNESKQNNQELFLQDIILGVQKYDVALLPWDLGLYWEGRFYLPTSKISREDGLITRFRNEFIFTRVFDRRWEAEYVQKFSYYFQSRTAVPVHFQDDKGFDVDTTKLTKQTELDHWLAIWYKLSPQTAVGWSLGGEDTTWFRSTALSKSKAPEHMIKTGPEVRFPVSDRANFILLYEDVVNRRENLPEFGRFLAKNTKVTLLSFIRF